MMTLVDTSVWIDHFRRGNARLAELLEEGRVLTQPFVIGELACGNLRNREKILDLLSALPSVSCVRHEEALHFIESAELFGRGLGWTDVHLLASARLESCRFWTLDRRLASAAGALGCGIEDSRVD